MGFKSAARMHPALVVRGTSYEGGPVIIAPGSSSFTDEPGLPIIRITPADVVPAGCLTSAETRFYLTRMVRVPQQTLKAPIGCLNDAMLADLRRARQSLPPIP